MTQRAHALILVFAAALAVAGPSTSQLSAQSPATPKRNIGGPGDYALREKLIGRMMKDPEVSRAGLTIIMVNGGAVFSGEVQTCSVRRRALMMAAAMRGIVNVTDLTRVAPADLPDEALRDTIIDILGDMAQGFGIRDLEVRVEDSVATLNGIVRDFTSRVEVEEVVGTILGVTRISNHLRPEDAPVGTDDVSITSSVVSYLGEFRRYSHSGEIQVRVQDGVVTLTGRVPTYMARQQAAVMASVLGGVESVDARLVVDPSVPVMREATVTALP